MSATYLARWQSGAVGLPWQHEFDMASDAMAIGYIRRHMKTSLELRHAHRLDLFRVHPDEKLVGSFRHGEIEVLLEDSNGAKFTT